MKLFTFILFFISSTNLLGSLTPSDVITSIIPPSGLGAPLELKDTFLEWGESIQSTLASVLEREDFSTSDKITLISKRYFRGYTMLMLAACFGFEETYKKMKDFLIEKRAFNEGDHIQDGYYVEEMLQRKTLTHYEETIRLSFTKNPRGDKIVEKIWTLSNHSKRRETSSPILLRRILHNIQDFSSDDSTLRKLSQSPKNIQASYFHPLLKRVVENYLTENELPTEFTFKEFLHILLGPESDAFNEFFSPEESKHLCEWVKILLFNSGRLNAEEARPLFAQLDAEEETDLETEPE